MTRIGSTSSRSLISPDSVEKFNPYHDQIGRFTDPYHFVTFTSQTRDPNKQHWANNATARHQQWLAAQKPKKTYDRLGFADQDDAAYHQLYNGRQYYQQQKLDSKQLKAAANYLEAKPEPGSLYSHSQIGRAHV